ncbi:hypothetical protein [Actinophytocola sp. NPDC049390]|uniref:hypothetical protein n=1 Tax=Actinophytocola sp. NPDC049390 TaxID=3363894 RepID=UPI00378B6ECA
MAWEWVAPTVTGAAAMSGMFFTWLTGRQSRLQVERMARRTEESAARDRLAQERRDAYFAALRSAAVTLERMRFQRKGEHAKLAEIDQTWPRGTRSEMAMDAVIAVETYGTLQARLLLRKWMHAAADDDEQRLRATRDAMVDLVRRELGAQFPADIDGSSKE